MRPPPSNTFARLAPWVTTPLIVVLFALGWQAYVTTSGISKFILPPPWNVVLALGVMLHDPITYHHLAVTLYEAVGGFLIASIFGVAFGVLLGKITWLEQALQPLVVAVQVTPKVALIPLFVLWFGFGPTSKVVIAAVLAFLPIMSNTILGVKSIETGHRDVMSSLAAGRVHNLFLLELPSAMPYVLTGMEVGIILAMIGAVVGEFLGASEGLGHLAVVELNTFKVDALFGDIILLAVAGALLYVVVVALRKMLVGWHATSGLTGL